MTLQTLSSYGKEFQIKVIAALLTDKIFLVNVNDILTDEYWENQGNKWIIKEIIKYYHRFHTNPTMDILKIELKKIENEVLQLSIKEQLKLAYSYSDLDDLAYIKEEFASFCKNQQLKKALLTSVDFLNAGDYDSIRSLIDNALRAGQDKNIGHEYNKDIESRYREDGRKTIPTPWETINNLLGGGLGSGDFGLIFGNPGGGKSWALTAIGGFAAELGYNVLHYTLELGEDYVGRRYDAFFTGIDVSRITEKQYKSTVEAKVESLRGQVLIKEYSPGRASIHTIESHIKKCIHQGIIPDLIIIDYVDLLRSKKNNRERKDEIDDIYISTKGLAKELKLPIWSVSQVNRAGAKDNIIEGDKAAGSYDKMMISDFAASLSRKKEDKVNGTGRWHIMKNRYGMDGMTYNSSINTSNGHIEIEEIYEGNNEEEPPKITQSGNINVFEKQKLKEQFYRLEQQEQQSSN